MMNGAWARWRMVSCGLVVLVLGGAIASAADGDAVAIVNGRPISKWRLREVLMEGYGLQVMQQLIVLELVRAESKRAEIKITQGDIDAEFQQALAKIAGQANEAGAPLSDAEKRQALDFMLQQKCVSMPEFMIGMERNAHLRKLVEREFRVTDQTLRAEFARQYGERVEVRHIQVNDVRGLHEALNLLDKDVAFEEVARRVSKNSETAARGGLLEPFTFTTPDDEIAPAIREQAFAMQPGEISKPLHIGRWWHILKLERRIPPQDVTFDAVRDEVAKKLRARVIPEMMNERVTELFQKAQIRVLDPELRMQYEKMLEEKRESP